MHALLKVLIIVEVLHFVEQTNFLWMQTDLRLYFVFLTVKTELYKRDNVRELTDVAESLGDVYIPPDKTHSIAVVCTSGSCFRERAIKRPVSV